MRQILLVEDDEMVRRSTASLLERAGHQVRSFENGDALLEQGIPGDAECILLDIRMPGRNGIEVLKELDKRGVEVPVVVVTGHGDVPGAVEAMKLGAVEFLQKPYRVENLLNVIDRLVDSGGSRAPRAERREAMDRMRCLTNRQREVLEGIVRGEASKIIAFRLGLSVRTVEAYRAQLLDRLGVRSAAEAIRIATIAGLARGMSRNDVRH